MFSEQLFFEAIFGSSFGTPAFDRDIRAGVHVNLFAESNSATDNVGTAKLSGAFATGSHAFRRALHGHALGSTSAVDFVEVGSFKVDDNFVSILYHYPIQYDKLSESPSTLITCVCLDTTHGTPRR